MLLFLNRLPEDDILRSASFRATWHGCSVAALYLVERLKSEVMAAAATHFQALAVGQARSRTIKRLARNPPGHRQPMHVRTHIPPPLLIIFALRDPALRMFAQALIRGLLRRSRASWR